jgi:hypothetical protein
MIWLALAAFLLWKFMRRMDEVDEQGRPCEERVGGHLPRPHVSIDGRGR